MRGLKLVLAAMVFSLFSTTNVMGSPIVRSEKNIVEIASASGDFKTLVAAVKAADLVEALSGEGLTVFAPTDSAFAKLPAGTVEFLLANIDQLAKVLTYHVVGAEKSPKQLLKGKTIQTLEGGSVSITLSDSRKLLINNSVVVAKPIYASNGVIYVIDTVLLP